MRNDTKRAPILAIAAFLACGTLAAADDLWLHVRVEEDGGGSTVNVNLPMSMIEKAMPLVSQHAGRHHGRIVLDDVDVELADLRAVWAEIMSGPDMTYVTIDDHDETVRVAKDDGYLLVDIEESWDGGDRVKARVPLGLVEAVLASPDGEIDIAAVVGHLRTMGSGDLVTVDGDDERVHVWIDERPEAQ